jgi:hypothetical protein
VNDATARNNRNQPVLHRQRRHAVSEEQICSAISEKYGARACIACELHRQYFFIEKAPTMKQAITVRIDPELLAIARACAKQENRTLTNFLETALKERVGFSESSRIPKQQFEGRKRGSAVSKGSLQKGSLNAKS